MNIDKKIELVKRLPTEEIVSEEELRALFETKSHPVAYDGFEPSGKAHIASGLMRAQKIGDLLEAGIKFKLYIADWHGWINNKMDGDFEKIQEVGEYLIKVWESLGLDSKKIEIRWASEHVQEPEYWKKVIEIAKHTTVQRMTRCGQIMGRKEEEMQHVSQLFYPAMQAADVFQLECDITQLGMDQRRVYMLSREVGPKLGLWKPVVVSHHMLMGLQGPTKMEMDLKMSKSKPNTALFMHDSTEDINKKLNEAFCPAKQTDKNPVLELCKYVIFRGGENELTIGRPSKYGGDVTYPTYEGLETDFVGGKLHPGDLKPAVAREIDLLVNPCRSYFEKHPKYLELFE